MSGATAVSPELDRAVQARDWLDEVESRPVANRIDRIPHELKLLPNFVCWRYEKRDGRETKVPYNARTGDLARANDPKTWSTFAQALAVVSRYNGIGFEISEPLVGFDFDGVIDEAVEPYADEVLRLLGNPYSEITPSGKGIRAFVKGILPPGRRKIGGTKGGIKRGVEIYDKAHYFTLTGNRHRGNGVPECSDLTVPYLICFDEKFRALWMGDISAYSDDHSRADLALCGMLARAYANDVHKIEAAFGQSRLGQRDKWRTRADCRQSTITKALSGHTAAPPPPLHIEAKPASAAKRPQLTDEALYGLAGDIIRKLIPETESHPAAMLAETLMSFGNIIGRSAYYEVEDTKHYGNLFAVKVGISSKSRKGTASARISRIFEQVDNEWAGHRIFSGLSSGEGVIWNVRDARIEGDKLDDEGVTDQRMFVYEGEFASPLAVMKREGNTLSPIIRNAWDGKALRSMVKNSPTCSTGAHISILGDITQDELWNTLSQSDRNNGFANRFLWLHVERCGLKPFGGEAIDFTDEIERLKDAVEFAKLQQRIFMDRNAREMWGRSYERLSAPQPGLFGAVTARAEAQVIRLSLLYALLDQSDHITPEHLKAGMAVWQYAEDSARFIFGGLTADQRKVIAFLADGPRTKTEIHRECFHGHRTADAIRVDLEALQREGKVRSKTDDVGTERFLLTESL